MPRIRKAKGSSRSTAVQFGWTLDPEGDGQKCVRDKLAGESGLLQRRLASCSGTMHSADSEQGGTGGSGAELVPDHGQILGKLTCRIVCKKDGLQRVKDTS